MSACSRGWGRGCGGGRAAMTQQRSSDDTTTAMASSCPLSPSPSPSPWTVAECILSVTHMCDGSRHGRLLTTLSVCFCPSTLARLRHPIRPIQLRPLLTIRRCGITGRPSSTTDPRSSRTTVVAAAARHTRTRHPHRRHTPGAHRRGIQRSARGISSSSSRQQPWTGDTLHQARRNRHLW